jgi:tripartite-type tricarboxylate transporter receptor subunit TctC
MSTRGTVMTSSFFRRAALACALSLPSIFCMAQSFPDKPIYMVIPYAPGGGADIVGRLISQKVGASLGQQVIIENLSGASGNIGAAHVARSKPDGYTLLFTGPNHTTNISLYDNLSYDPIKDFAPISLLTSAPYILDANPSQPIHSVKELIDLARSKPNQLAFGSAGNGTAGHLAMELLMSSAKIKMTHIPYKGSAPMLNDLLGGRVAVAFDNVLSSLPFIKSGALRAIATTGAHRSPSLPDVPTIAESGLPGFDVEVWQGVLAPAGTPASVVNLLHDKFVAALKTPEVTARLASMNIDMSGTTPGAFGAFLKEDIAKWAKVIKASGAHVD